MPKRSEIWLADLNPAHGTEPGKTRPVLVVQCDALLEAGHPSTVIVPLTTNIVDDAEPLRIPVPRLAGMKRKSDLLIDQLRAIDNRRLVKGPLARLPQPIMEKVEDAMLEVLGVER
jgi:mRNA interferase MazF